MPKKPKEAAHHFNKGHVFYGPDGQGYTLTKYVKKGDAIEPSDFAEFGGAPKVEAGEKFPDWLVEAVTE